MTALSRDEILNMPVTDRLALIGELWDSMPDEKLPIPPAHRAELERRLVSFEHDIEEGVSWDELKAELEALTA